MTKRRIAIEGRGTYGPYSPGVEIGDRLYLSGQIAPDAGDISAQTKGALERIDELLLVAGFRRSDVVQVQVLLADITDFAAVNEVYAEFFADNRIPPARVAHQAAALPAGAAIEIVATAERAR